MKYDELVQHLTTAGNDAAHVVAWHVVDSVPDVDVRYNIVIHQGKHAVVTLVTDRSNGTPLFHEHPIPSGPWSWQFATADDACDWIWERVNDHVFTPSGPQRTREQAQQQHANQTDRVARARQATRTHHPEQLADWPPGFMGYAERPLSNQLTPGDVIEHLSFRGKDGFFASPEGTPLQELAVPPDRLDPRYTTVKYAVIRHLPDTVVEGVIIPGFFQPGGGSQYYFPGGLEQAVARGFLRVISN